MAAAIAGGLGLIRLDLKWPVFGLDFIFCNLLLTCVAEEAFFRGLLQGQLHRFWQQSRNPWLAQQGQWLALLLVALLFGLAHLAGGLAYALVATVAGLGYGWAYLRGGVTGAVLTHFAVNLLHLAAFSYPMLRPALL